MSELAAVPDEAPDPRVPDGLNAAGRRLWREITGVYVLEPREATVLEAACRQVDDVARLEGLIESGGLVVEGSKGQPRLAPWVAEVRAGRLAVSRLLDALHLPEDVTETADGKSRRAKRAADARWARQREQRERADRRARGTA